MYPKLASKCVGEDDPEHQVLLLLPLGLNIYVTMLWLYNPGGLNQGFTHPLQVLYQLRYISNAHLPF